MIHTLISGDRRPDLAFLHGLFGQGKNWAGIAKLFHPKHTSLLLDLPNHGRSSNTRVFDYERLADLVAAELRRHLGRSARINLVGHSMGGKVAMLVALRHPSLVKRLVVADISPTRSAHVAGFLPLVEAMQSLDLTAISNRAGADVALAKAVDDTRLRSFLLQNLRRTEGAWRWSLNLELLGASLGAIGGWPDVKGRYLGPTLWLKGATSTYIRPDHHSVMRSYFPQLGLVEIPGAGHWLHAERPQEFTHVVREFIDHDLIVQP